MIIWAAWSPIPTLLSVFFFRHSFICLSNPPSSSSVIFDFFFVYLSSSLLFCFCKPSVRPLTLTPSVNTMTVTTYCSIGLTPLDSRGTRNKARNSSCISKQKRWMLSLSYRMYKSIVLIFIGLLRLSFESSWVFPAVCSVDVRVFVRLSWGLPQVLPSSLLSWWFGTFLLVLLIDF